MGRFDPRRRCVTRLTAAASVLIQSAGVDFVAVGAWVRWVGPDLSLGLCDDTRRRLRQSQVGADDTRRHTYALTRNLLRCHYRGRMSDSEQTFLFVALG